MKNLRIFFYPIVLKVHNIRTTFSSHPLWESATPFFVVCCLGHRKNLLLYTVWIRKVWPREKKKPTRIWNEFLRDVIFTTSNLEMLLKINLFKHHHWIIRCLPPQYSYENTRKTWNTEFIKSQIIVSLAFICLGFWSRNYGS